MITVGTDTYITVADADAYVTGHYPSTDRKHAAWVALSTHDQEIHLRIAAARIDRLPLRGMKLEITQAMAFPRLVATVTTLDDLEIPLAVKQAQVEIALALAAGPTERERLRRDGVRAYRLGELSETLADPGQSAVIPAQAAIELLRPWLGGGVAIV